MLPKTPERMANKAKPMKQTKIQGEGVPSELRLPVNPKIANTNQHEIARTIETVERIFQIFIIAPPCGPLQYSPKYPKEEEKLSYFFFPEAILYIFAEQTARMRTKK